jgi:hypothetical protein
MKLKLKSEYKLKTVTVKQKWTSITYNLWNLNQTAAEFLYNNGYKHIFEPLISDETSETSNENNEVSNETVVKAEDFALPKEELFPLTAKKGCSGCKTEKQKAKRKPKI